MAKHTVKVLRSNPAPKMKHLGTKGNTSHRNAALNITFPEYGQGTRTGAKKGERFYDKGLGIK